MRPVVKVFGQLEWTCLPGTITGDGNRFFSQFEEYVTTEHAKNII